MRATRSRTAPLQADLQALPISVRWKTSPVFGNECEKRRLYLVPDGHSLRLCIDRVFSDEDLAIPEGRGDVRYWYDVAPQDINWLLPRASDGPERLRNQVRLRRLRALHESRPQRCVTRSKLVC